MQANNLVLTALSYGAAVLAYVVLAFALWRRGYGKAPYEWVKTILLAAALLSAVWAALVVAQVLGGEPLFCYAGRLVDVLRYGAWFGFLSLVQHMGRSDQEKQGQTWLPRTVAITTVLAFVLQIMAALDLLDTLSLHKLVLFSTLSLPVLGMVLL